MTRTFLNATCAFLSLFFGTVQTRAASYIIHNAVADAFVASGSPETPGGSDLSGLNFGGAATLAIASGATAKGEFNSVIRFSFAGAVAAFDEAYGEDQWQISGLTLSLASNFGTTGAQPNNSIFNPVHAGMFGIDWLSRDDWIEGNAGSGGAEGFPTTSLISLNSLPALLGNPRETVGVYQYTPPGNNIYLNYSFGLPAGLVADATAGGEVSLYLYATDQEISYLFNARSFAANRPMLTVSAIPIPEPGWPSFTLMAGVALLLQRARKNSEASSRCAP